MFAGCVKPVAGGFGSDTGHQGSDGRPFGNKSMATCLKDRGISCRLAFILVAEPPPAAGFIIEPPSLAKATASGQS
jgi:hypothetical protein